MEKISDMYDDQENQETAIDEEAMEGWQTAEHARIPDDQEPEI